jgi:hypothetical protein
MSGEVPTHRLWRKETRTLQARPTPVLWVEADDELAPSCPLGDYEWRPIGDGPAPTERELQLFRETLKEAV